MIAISVRFAIKHVKRLVAVLAIMSLTSCDIYLDNKYSDIPVTARERELAYQMAQDWAWRDVGRLGLIAAILVGVVVVVAWVVVTLNGSKTKKALMDLEERHTIEVDDMRSMMEAEQKREEMTLAYKQGMDKMERELAAKDRSMTAMQSYIYDHLSIASKLLSINDETMSMPMSAADWTELEVYLNTTSDDFVKRLRNAHPDIEEKVLRFCMLLRLKLTNRQMAVVYGIADKSVKQRAYTYKNKLKGVPDGVSLRDYIENM
mgnify:CR=1 FL=1